ncbi:MAG: FAD:protein FMN transferase [Planctomycetes bacterium]|nr:FAD:protein FMN transferase [Planctomycetota bacterium]
MTLRLYDFGLFADEPAEPPGEFVLIRVSRRAMATTFEVAIPAGTHPEPIAAATAALDLIDELEDQMTVYREHSEVVQLNETASVTSVEVEPQLFELFTRCAGWTHESEGAFDIATGAIIKAWGFFKREGRVPSPSERIEAMNRTGFRHVILNPETHTVKFRVPGLEINLGAVGKGYALDRAAHLLRTEWGVTSALLHGGGSSVYAIGGPPGDLRGWPIQLRHPTDTNASLGTVYLRNRGLGTSAATFQFFEYKGQKLGHLLDPRTGWPAQGIQSVSVTATTAAEADAISTAVFVLGLAGTEKLLHLKPGLGVVLLPEQDPSLTPPPRGEGLNPTPPSFLGRGGGGLGSLVFNLTPDSFSPAHAD